MYKKIISLAFISLLINGCGDTNVTKDKVSNDNTGQIKVTEDAVNTNVADKKSKHDGGQFYYSNDKEKKSSSYNAESTKVRTTIDAYLHIKSPYERVRITMMIKRLSSDYVIKCSPCHDDYANGVIGPSLLDKDDKFIYDQIIAFKTGKKKNPLMKELVNQIDNEKLKNIAKEIANFNKEIRKMRSGK